MSGLFFIISGNSRGCSPAFQFNQTLKGVSAMTEVKKIIWRKAIAHAKVKYLKLKRLWFVS